jgi:hypothetical protein
MDLSKWSASKLASVVAGWCGLVLLAWLFIQGGQSTANLLMRSTREAIEDGRIFDAEGLASLIRYRVLAASIFAIIPSLALFVAWLIARRRLARGRPILIAWGLTAAFQGFFWITYERLGFAPHMGRSPSMFLMGLFRAAIFPANDLGYPDSGAPFIDAMTFLLINFLFWLIAFLVLCSSIAAVIRLLRPTRLAAA